MRAIEADWICKSLLALGPEKASPVANLGSSTGWFRSVKKPHIEQRLLKPLRDAGFEILHVDLKEAEGVDLAGDLYDETVRTMLQSRGFRSAIFSNVLEHVPDPATLAAMTEEIVAPGGYLLVTVPRAYPYHPDPIDTLFRPTPDELVALYRHCDALETVVLTDGTPFDDERALGLAHVALMPVRWAWLIGSGLWRPQIARACIARIMHMLRPVAVTCALLHRHRPA
ncbi:class I SAM-dependent methyltransferase [Sphingosinicellaceae bacterium]|nr:class I SAM-dependent methyltransferase [Sphingosinicellaceae bacterium]